MKVATSHTGSLCVTAKELFFFFFNVQSHLLISQFGEFGGGVRLKQINANKLLFCLCATLGKPNTTGNLLLSWYSCGHIHNLLNLNRYPRPESKWKQQSFITLEPLKFHTAEIASMPIKFEAPSFKLIAIRPNCLLCCTINLLQSDKHTQHISRCP